MKLYMLHEERLGPIPEDITELQCFDDHLEIVVGDDAERIFGRSVYLEGPKESFVEWLKPFDGVWLGKGSPFMEQFEICHIREENQDER